MLQLPKRVPHRSENKPKHKIQYELRRHATRLQAEVQLHERHYDAKDSRQHRSPNGPIFIDEHNSPVYLIGWMMDRNGKANVLVLLTLRIARVSRHLPGQAKP